MHNTFSFASFQQSSSNNNTQTLNPQIHNNSHWFKIVAEMDNHRHVNESSWFCIILEFQIFNSKTLFSKLNFLFFLKLHNDDAREKIVFFFRHIHFKQSGRQSTTPLTWPPSTTTLEFHLALGVRSIPAYCRQLTSWLRAAFMPRLSTLRGKRRDVSEIIPDIFTRLIRSFC